MRNNTALLVIDVQVGMFEGPEGPVYDAERVLEKIAGLIHGAREAGTPVIYVQHSEDSGGILERGTPLWEIHPDIAPLPDETIVEKRTPDSFHDTTLQRELNSRELNRLVLTGAQTECCVDATCRRAFSPGYDVILVEDAHNTWDTEHVSAEQLIAHHNQVLGGWFSDAVEAGAIDFAVPAGVNRH